MSRCNTGTQILEDASLLHGNRETGPSGKQITAEAMNCLIGTRAGLAVALCRQEAFEVAVVCDCD